MSARTVEDVWSAERCGLINEECATALADLHMGPDDGVRSGSNYPTARRATEGAHDGAITTYVAGEPSYVPYESKKVTHYGAGVNMCRRVISAVFSPEVSTSTRSSPFAATALATAVSIRRSLGRDQGTPTSRRLTVLEGIAPRKGNEARQLLHEYGMRNADSAEHAAPMVMRDFYASMYAWQFIRSVDGRIHDLCGSALCLTTAVDYVGASDDPGGGGYDAYLSAASEGVACLDGKAATQALKDIVITDSFMMTKDAMVHESENITDLNGFVTANGGPVTPNEFLQARWWDAAMVPYHRLVMSTPGYRHLTDELGTFRAADRCDKIKRAVDNIIRYNETVDIVSDYRQTECFNELLLALAIGGSGSVTGYGDALAAVTDDVIDCDCGERGHDEAAEAGHGRLPVVPARAAVPGKAATTQLFNRRQRHKKRLRLANPGLQTNDSRGNDPATR